MDDLYDLNLNNIDLDIRVRDLAREIVITVRALDDETFRIISEEATKLKDEIKK
jgi:hypothetical protein